MKSKDEILIEIQEALNVGIITEGDLKSFIHAPSPVPTSEIPVEDSKTKKEKMTAVDAMYYIAGIVLYSAILSIIVQSWNENNSYLHILFSAGVGGVLWSMAYRRINNPLDSDVRKGLINVLLLTGSLLVITGGYILTNELIGGFEDASIIPAAIMLAVLGWLHIGFDRLIQRKLILLMGVLLSVASFPVLLAGILQNADLPMDVWSVIIIVSAWLLTYTTRVLSKMNPERQNLKSSFDSFAVFVALATMYVTSFGGYGLLWLLVLIASVFGIFYLSITLQNKHLLGNASFFLVLTVVTIAFRYFSGYGVSVSLILATLGLLGSAAIASNINKKYFKQATEIPVNSAEEYIS